MIRREVLNVPERGLQRREQAALIEEIVRSPWFTGTGARFRIKLLRYLFAQQSGVSTKELLEKVFPHLNPTAATIDERMLGDVRQHCRELRTALINFNLSTVGQRQSWRCELPEAIPSQGYKLEFVNQSTSRRPTLGFWYAHINPEREIKIVCNEPLVYRNPTSNLIFRFADMTDDDVPPERAVELLKRDHADLYSEGVYSTRTYMLSGEIEARDYIDDWFGSSANRKTTSGVSRSMNQAEIDESSPILLGNTRTNKFIRNLLRDEAPNLDFRATPEQFGIVELRHATPSEFARLRSEYPDNIQSDEGTVVLKDHPQRDVFAIMTRIPNPSGEGAVTMIYSDYTQCLGQVARTLTDDARLSTSLEELQWPLDKLAPAAFQGLFAVRLRQRGNEAKKPVLVAARRY